MHDKVLPRGSAHLLEQLAAAQSPDLEHWILAGGTGLALRLGHRVSDDFDFFRTDSFDATRLHHVFKSIGPYETLEERAPHSLTVISLGVKLSFFSIDDPFIFPVEPYRFFSIAHESDIALMKLIAISGRGSRKDFVDLYRILMGDMTLQHYFDLLPKKYGAGRANTYHILKSLTYFADAEEEPPPRMLEPLMWEECKAFFVREAHHITLG